MLRTSFGRVSLLLLMLYGSLTANAAVPTADGLLSDQTLAYVRIRNTAELANGLQQTALGQALRDPQVRPLIEHLWSSLVPTLEKVEEQLGMGLDELAAASPGQLALALVDAPSGPPAVVVMFRPERPAELEKTLNRGTERLEELGFAQSSEAVAGAQARILTRSEGSIQELIQLQLDDWRIVTTDRDVAGELVAAWQGANIPLLREHGPYRTIMTRCAFEGNTSQFDFYLDPLGTASALTRDNFAATAAMAFLPAIGADGFQAIGGCLSVANENYDMFLRAHLLLEPPRDGVLKVLAIQQGTSEPEVWVPGDVANYVTWHWNVQRTFTTVRELVDSFRGDGATTAFVQRRLSDRLGVDVEKEVLPLLAGRITRVIRYEQPPSLNSQSTAVGIELTDATRFKELWSKVVEKFSDSIERTSFAGVEVYQLTRTNEPSENPAEANTDDQGDQRDRRQRRRAEARQRWQQLRPAAAIVGDSFIVADRITLLHQILMSYDGAEPRLKDQLDYKLVISNLKRQSTTPPGMIRFERPEEGLRSMYQLLQTDEVRRQIHEARERHPFFQALDQLLVDNRLPSFAVLSQYLAPGGSMLINEESGFHYVSFGLRRQPQ